MRGPGQKAVMRCWAVWERGVVMECVARSEGEEMWRISGLSGGRFFAAKILRQAAWERAFAPRPKTVSVGKATRLSEVR